MEKTREGYDELAGAFADSRTDLWEEQQAFGALVHDNYRVLDMGCGNGRLLKLFENLKISYTGMDNSGKLLAKAQQYAKNFPRITSQFVQGNIMKLPFEDGAFNVIMCIATLHHIPSSEYQLATLREIKRVLDPEGQLCMTNWNLSEQPRYVKRRDKLREEHPELFEGLEEKDFMISWRWRLLGKTVYRYYHSFDIEELSLLLTQAGFRIEKQFISENAPTWDRQMTKRNIVTVARKLS